MTMNAPVYGLVMMALLMASASGQTFTEGEATCVGCFRSANDCDWSATAINIASPTRTPRGDEGCAALCMVNTACTHYTFIVLFPGDGYCIQKSATASATLTIPTFGPPGIGSSCGWMFGRSLQISPPGFVAAAVRVARDSSIGTSVALPDEDAQIEYGTKLQRAGKPFFPSQ